MALLDAIGRGLMDMEDGFEAPPSPEGLSYLKAVLRRARERDPDEWSPEEIEECARDLIAFVLTGQDEGWALAQSVEAWAQEWGLDDA